MSREYRDKPKLVKICDLCGNELTDDGGPPAGQASVIAAQRGLPATPDTKYWSLLWQPRLWGRHQPSHSEVRADPERYRPREYDMHTECLIKLIEDHIKTRQDA